MKRVILRYVLPALAAFTVGVFLLNTNRLAPPSTEKPLVIATAGLVRPSAATA